MVKELGERTWEIINAIADCDRNINEVARRLYMHRTNVQYHINKVKRITWLDPVKFRDLCKLLDMVEVVRCKDCKHYDEDCEFCKFWDGVRHPEHFCGEGGRRTDG